MQPHLLVKILLKLIRFGQNWGEIWAKSISCIPKILISYRYVNDDKLSEVKTWSHSCSTCSDPTISTSIWKFSVLYYCCSFLNYVYLYRFNFWLLLCPTKLSYDYSVTSIPLTTTVWESRNITSFLFLSLCIIFPAIATIRLQYKVRLIFALLTPVI